MRFITPERARRVNVDAIIHMVEDAYGYQHGTLAKRTNQAHIAHPRHLVCFLLAEAGLSMPHIGRIFGKHHTTILHSRDFVVRSIDEDEDVRILVDKMRITMRADPQRFTRTRERLKSVIKIVPKQIDPPLLPSVAHGQFRGTEDLDELIRAGKGDQPRATVEEVLKRKRG